MTTIATLCYIVSSGKILLIKKKKGGNTCWNGANTEVKNYDISFSASKEMYDEIKIVPAEIKKVGEIELFSDDKLECIIHIFLTDEYDGVEKETEIATPKWFKIDRIPYDEMWPGDRFWMPLMIVGKKFDGRFYFDSEAKNLLKHEVKELNADAIASD